MRTIGLSYSIDGTNFSDTVNYNVLEIYCDLSGETESQGSETNRADGKVCSTLTNRHKVDIVFSRINFNPEDSDLATAQLKARFLETWINAPKRRLYFANGSDYFPAGWNLFDTNNNTNYLMKVNSSITYSKRFRKNMQGRKVIKWEVELQTLNAYTLLLYKNSAWS